VTTKVVESGVGADSMALDRRREALERIKVFVLNAKKLIEGISVGDLIDKGGVNPYMARALGMSTIDEVVGFFVNRRVERSLGTSFGNVLDSVLRILVGGKAGKDLVNIYGKWIKWWDIVLPEEKIVISVKSGPADMDKDQVEYFADRAKEAKEYGFSPFLVFMYGKKAFQVIESYLRKNGLDPDECLRIGKSVFEEFLKDPTHYKYALELFQVAGNEAGDIFGLIESKINSLTEELKRRYNDDLDKMFEDMF
jgi:hypothetical protein